MNINSFSFLNIYLMKYLNLFEDYKFIMYFNNEIKDAINQLDYISKSNLDSNDNYLNNIITKIDRDDIKSLLVKNIKGDINNNLEIIKNILINLSGSEPYMFFNYIYKIYVLCKKITS